MVRLGDQHWTKGTPLTWGAGISSEHFAFSLCKRKPERATTSRSLCRLSISLRSTIGCLRGNQPGWSQVGVHPHIKSATFSTTRPRCLMCWESAGFGQFLPPAPHHRRHMWVTPLGLAGEMAAQMCRASTVTSVVWKRKKGVGARVRTVIPKIRETVLLYVVHLYGDYLYEDYISL